MKTAMQDLIEDINIEKKLGYITENAANKILDYINNLYLEKEKEQILNSYVEGRLCSYNDNPSIKANQYYNQTYNQNK